MIAISCHLSALFEVKGFFFAYHHHLVHHLWFDLDGNFSMKPLPETPPIASSYVILNYYFHLYHYL